MSHKYFFAVWAAISMLLTSCKKDEYWGEFYTLKNGIEWQGKIRAQTNEFFGEKANISIETFDNEGAKLEHLHFFKIPLRLGRYYLSNTHNQPSTDTLVGCRYFNGYDDQLFDTYEIAPTDSKSYIEITEYNEGNGELRGNFEVILWPDSNIPGSWNAPDSLVFSDGVFHTRID